VKETVIIFMIAALLSLWVASVGLPEDNYSTKTDIQSLLDTMSTDTDISDLSSITGWFESAKSIVFSLNDDEELLFTWEDGTFHIKYPEGKIDEADKKFVEWLEQYMNKDYCKGKKD